jgi:hypothetical protein
MKQRTMDFIVGGVALVIIIAACSIVGRGIVAVADLATASASLLGSY